MSDRGLSQLLAVLRRRAAPKSDLVSDGELLGRYVVSRDEAAFELLVRRHGGMVIGVAHRVLQDTHAAEDVYQAAFLTLARKARTLRRHESLAGWLYRVTLRIALRSKSTSFSARRIQVDAVPESETPAIAEASAEWRELRSILDEEIDQLPERFRSSIVLCYFSGKSTEEAAQLLGCPRGTVLSRLAAARERLREGLSKRGYVVSTALITAGLTSETAPAGLSVMLVALAMKVIGPATTVAPAVASLSYGVVHAMLMTKMKIAAALVLAAGGLGFGVSQLGAGDDEQKKPTTRLEKQNKQADDDARRKQRDEDLARQKADEQKILDRIAEERKQLEVKRQDAEVRMIELLKVASERRVNHKTRILDLDDKIDELRQQMAPTTKMLDQYLLDQVAANLKLDDMRRPGGASDAAFRQQEESVAYLDRVINNFRNQLQKLRVEIRTLRRQKLETEEQLSLQDKIADLEMERFKRNMP